MFRPGKQLVPDRIAAVRMNAGNTGTHMKDARGLVYNHRELRQEAGRFCLCHRRRQKKDVPQILPHIVSDHKLLYDEQEM